MSFFSKISIQSKLQELKLFFKEATYKDISAYANFFALSLFVFSLPFSTNYSRFFLGLWVFTWLLEGNFIKRFKKNILSKEQHRLFYMFILFYLLHLVSYFFSQNKSVAAFDLEVKFSLLLFPILMLGSNKLYKEKWQFLLKIFLLGITISSIIYILLAFYKSIHIEQGKLLFNFAYSEEFAHLGFFELMKNRSNNFSYVCISIWHHPSYYAMFLNLAVAISYFLLKKTKSNFKKIILVIAVLFFMLMIYLLASRAGILSLILVLFTIFIVEFFLNKKIVIVFLPFLILITFFLTNVSSIKETVTKLLKKEPQVENKKEAENDAQQKDARLILLHHAILVAKENIWLGVGIGDIKTYLNESFNRENYKIGIEKAYNTHDQYLETLIGGGIVLLILLLILFAYSIYYALKERKMIMLLFLLFVGLNFLFEAMLNTMVGVIFITFFWTFLLFEKSGGFFQKNREVKNSPLFLM